MPKKPPTDEQLAAAAETKLGQNQKPSREEAAALRRVEKAREDQARADHYRAVPKKMWRQWSCRQDKVLNEQAARYGIPIGGATINVQEVAFWLHNFLAERSRQLAGDDPDDPDSGSASLERMRLAKARMEELRYERELGTWLPRKTVHDAHARIAAVLRVAGDALRRQFGAAAQKILNDALEDAKREVDRRFSDFDPGADDGD